MSAKVQQGKDGTEFLILSETSPLQPAYTLLPDYLDEDNDSSTHLI